MLINGLWIIAVTLPLLLFQVVAQSDSERSDGRSAGVLREKIIPFFLVEEDSDSSESKEVESIQDPDEKIIDIEKALAKLKEAEKVLEQLEEQESVNHPSFAKSINEKLSSDEDKDSSESFDSQRQGKINGVFTHPRLQTPPYKQQVDFDDSSADSQQLDYPIKNIITQGPQNRQENVLHDKADRLSSADKPSLLLTLGGYQHPFESERKQPLPTGSQNLVKVNKDNSEERANVNIIVPHVTYNDQPSGFMKIPGMGYQPPFTDTFPRTETGDNNQNIFSSYAAYPQGQKPVNSPISGQPLPQNSITNVSPFAQHNLYTPNSDNYYLNSNQPAQTDYFNVNNPFNSPSGLPYVSSALDTNPFQSIGFQTNNGALASLQNPSPNMLPVGNFFDASNAPSQLSNYQAYQNNPFFPTQLYQPPRFPVNTKLFTAPPASGIVQGRKNENVEQELESVSQEQHQNSPSGDVQVDKQQYMTVPSQNAGYGMLDTLPKQNDSVAPQDSRSGRLYPYHFNSAVYPYNHPYPHDQRYFSFPPIRDNTHYHSGGTNHPGTAGKDVNTGYMTDEYIKYLRSPFPFSQNPDLTFPRRNQQGESGSPGLGQFPWQSRDRTNASSEERNGTGLRSVFDFFPNGGVTTRTRINPDITPECAKISNTTICFEDPEYPRSDVLYVLDSEALMLRRLLPETAVEDTEDSEGLPTPDADDICQVEVRQGRPQRALDTEGKWRVIVNTGSDALSRTPSQNVRLEICSNLDEPCSHTDGTLQTRCVQKHSVQRLLSWDSDRGLRMAMFRFPVACSCQIVKTE